MPDTGEILVHLDYIRRGIDGLNTRLDTLNGRTRTAESEIAAIKVSVDNAQKTARDAAASARAAAKTSGRNHGAGWGAIGGFVAGFVSTWLGIGK